MIKKMGTEKKPVIRPNGEVQDPEVQEIRDLIELKRAIYLERFEREFLIKTSKFKEDWRNMSVNQIHDSVSSTTGQITRSNCTTGLLSTKNTTSTRLKAKRSSSCNDDEGYLTTGSSSSTGMGSHTSRSRLRQKLHSTKNKGHMQSLSRTRTPLNNIPFPQSYGLITPKVKPNTPLVLLRRPKMGELVVSVQGSPILAAPSAAENFANVNIPLTNGAVLSLQAQRGLRKSQVPEFDPEVKRQLELLKHNLDILL